MIFSSKQTVDSLPAAPEGEGEAVELWFDRVAQIAPQGVVVAFLDGVPVLSVGESESLGFPGNRRERPAGPFA
jgi:hypothetical protein